MGLATIFIITPKSRWMLVYFEDYKSCFNIWIFRIKLSSTKGNTDTRPVNVGPLGSNWEVFQLVTSIQSSKSCDIFSSLTKLFNYSEDFLNALEKNKAVKNIEELMNSLKGRSKTARKIFKEDVQNYLVNVFSFQKFKCNQFDYIFWNMKIDTYKYFKPSTGLSIKGEEILSPTPTYCNYKFMASETESDIASATLNESSRTRNRRLGTSPNHSRAMRSTTFSIDWSIADKTDKCPLHRLKDSPRKPKELIKPRLTARKYSFLEGLKRLCCLVNEV